MTTPEFWKSAAAAGYPDRITLKGKGAPLNSELEFRVLLGDQLRLLKLIPQKGQILDLGSGPCSGLIFGSYVASTRVTAVDGSKVMLAHNPVPRERKHQIELGSQKLPEKWRNRFQLASSIFLSRYLTQREERNLAEDVYRSLRPGGKYLIVDQRKVGSSQLAAIVGEAKIFDLKSEEKLLHKIGFRNIGALDFDSIRMGISVQIVFGTK